MVIRTLLSLWRRCRSVLLLLFTAILLFYYTFQNEIEHLNSYAYNDSLPLLQKQSHDEFSTSKKPEISHDEVESELNDIPTLIEKNKYFPMLFDNHEQALRYKDSVDWDPNYKPFHPLYEKKTVIPYKHLSGSYPHLHRLRSSHFNTLTKEELLHHWYSRLNRIKDHSQLDLQTNLSILSTDLLLNINGSMAFSLPQTIVLNDPVDPSFWSKEILGSLLAMTSTKIPETSETLSSATFIGNVLLRSYDTPNSLPQIPFYWQSLVRNRYAFRDTKTSLLSSTILEFLQLSHVTSDPMYESTIRKLIEAICGSAKQFDIDFLLPEHVDASGCKPLSEDKITKGEHLRESHVLKSIHDNKYIQCLISQSLYPTNTPQGNSVSLDIFDLYLTILKAFQLNNGNYYRKNPKDSVISTLLRSILQINATMLFEPWLPHTNSIILLPTSIRTKINFDVLQDRNEVRIAKDFRVTPDGAKLSSLFVIAGILFDDSTFIETGASITRGFYELFKLFNGVPSEVILDEKINSTPFDGAAKLQLIKSGFYESKDSLRGIKLKDEVPLKIKHYITIQDFVASPKLSDVNEERLMWKDRKWPFFVNDLKHSTHPPYDLIESLIYLYKYTENYEWKLIGEDIMHNIEWSSLSIRDTGKLIRLLHALFQDSVNIDEYVINSNYHFLERTFNIDAKDMKDSLKFKDLIMTDTTKKTEENDFN